MSKRPANSLTAPVDERVTAIAGIELLTAAEVAKVLRVARSTVYELDRLRELRSVVVARGASRACRRWLASDVRDYVLRERAADEPPSPASSRRVAARRRMEARRS